MADTIRGIKVANVTIEIPQGYLVESGGVQYTMDDNFIATITDSREVMVSYEDTDILFAAKDPTYTYQNVNQAASDLIGVYYYDIKPMIGQEDIIVPCRSWIVSDFGDGTIDIIPTDRLLIIANEMADET